ncbi:MAG: glycosyltransferase family 4 protein [Proteobacteria bacterium]|nr:glycosyltransferase family 4 protein [Pseudomonadota bacterium]MBU1544352.1 glycosyltransferase family 4 protein [Pseudomonadota bacterium]MBU2479907.1 glycosyltransferase family 4 protein [Pseudomonadota bacterium]
MRIMIMASGDLWAGAEVMIYTLVRGFSVHSNVSLRIILLNENRLAQELRKLGFDVVVIEESRHSFLGLVKAVRHAVAAFSPDIIHSHRYKENLLALFASWPKKNIKRVATQHGLPEVTGEGLGYIPQCRNWFFFRLLSLFFDRTILVSDEMRQRLIGSYGFSFKNTAVIHNGIDIPENINDRSTEKIIIGSAGRLFPVKDFGLFVDIACVLAAQNRLFHFVIAGDGPERKMLQEKIRERGLQERFELPGHQDDMFSFYKKLDVYVNTSTHEGIPMTALEAMSHGIPVVAPYVGGFPEIIVDGECGHLVGQRDASLFAEKIFELVCPAQRKKMAIAARHRAKEFFSQKSMAEKYLQVFDKLLTGAV